MVLCATAGPDRTTGAQCCLVNSMLTKRTSSRRHDRTIVKHLLLQRMFAITNVRLMHDPMSEATATRVISYARVSTGAQAASGLGIEAQHLAVQMAAVQQGWQIVDACTDDAVSANIEPAQRPELGAALERLDAGDADVIAAVRLDRFVRSNRDLLTLLDLSSRGGWEFIGLDVPITSEVPAGTFMRTVVGAFGELERSMISERTRAALAVARSQGKRLGRPSQQSPEARELATALRAEGLSLRKIAAALTESGIRTATGKSIWSASSIQGLLRTVKFDQEAEANAARHAAEQRNR